jgi:UDP-N-acetylmuramoyl-tripeptide--D-alanyl-D-alanine ligase
MLELGAHSDDLHRESARALAGADIDLVVATGLFIEAFASLAADHGDRLVTANAAEAAFVPLADRLRGDEVILLKGSRGVALERLIPRLEQRFGPGTPGNGG